jgi:1-acyl-sn-glycerol-3-phosphate acyltransferase
MWAWLLLLLALGPAWRYWRSSGLTLLEWVGRSATYAYARLWHRCTIHGTHRIPRSGPVILVANHTCSADPAFLLASSPRPISFLLAEEYIRLPVISGILRLLRCVPVQRNGRDLAAVRSALQRLRAGSVLGIFPEGGLSNAGRGRPRRFKAGAVLLALRGGAPVLPVLILGGPQTRHVLDAWLLPSCRRTHVLFGAPIALARTSERRDGRRHLERTMRQVMEQLWRLTPSKKANS